MTTPMMTAPSWEPNLLAASGTDAHVSADVPSAVGVRPFGMTQIETVADSQLIDADGLGLIYDPIRQVSTTDEGEAASDSWRILLTGSVEDTRYDNQWFVDKD